MKRRLALVPVLAYAIVPRSFSHAADATQIARVAVINPHSPSTTPPGDLPIEEPTQFELVVNLRTAKALKLTIPESVLLRANEVVR